MLEQLVITLVVVASVVGGCLILKLHEDETKLDLILMNQAELAAALAALKEQTAKIALEQRTRFDRLSGEIAELRRILDNADTVTPAVAESLRAVQAELQALDDSIPDAPAPAPADGSAQV